MRNIALKIQYIGTNYSGWQRQNNANSIQEEIEKAIFEVTGESCELQGSGRTDAGVHALGQVANFHTNTNIPVANIKFALNTKLPKDMSIINSVEVDENFNARFDAVGKTYIYLIENSEVKSPFYKDFAMNVRDKIDIDKMVDESKALIGMHDFTSFYKIEKDNAKNPVREIYKIDIKKKKQNIIKIIISGNGFLYNMVRIVAGTLIEISTGKKDRSIKEILDLKNRDYAGTTALSCGLYLKKVEYKQEILI